ncbi:MAG TPA: hypothetical protein VEV41_24600 [Terriglobales bacterium]|nr:hypothetical protein [Terriglobales bacterium]
MINLGGGIRGGQNRVWVAVTVDTPGRMGLASEYGFAVHALGIRGLLVAVAGAT